MYIYISKHVSSLLSESICVYVSVNFRNCLKLTNRFIYSFFKLAVKVINI